MCVLVPFATMVLVGFQHSTLLGVAVVVGGRLILFVL